MSEGSKKYIWLLIKYDILEIVLVHYLNWCSEQIWGNFPIQQPFTFSAITKLWAIILFSTNMVKFKICEPASLAIDDYPSWDNLILSPQKPRIGIEWEWAIHLWVSLALNAETWVYVVVRIPCKDLEKRELQREQEEIFSRPSPCVRPNAKWPFYFIICYIVCYFLKNFFPIFLTLVFILTGRV